MAALRSFAHAHLGNARLFALSWTGGFLFFLIMLR